MAIICPQCSLENPDQSTFCARCGAKLTQDQNPASTTNGPSQPYTMPAEPIMQQSFPAQSAPGEFQQNYPPPVPGTYQQMQPPTMYAQLNTAPPPPIIPLSAQLGRRAFAGHGYPVSRASWLIADQQAQATAVLTAARESLMQRGLPGLSINQARLTERSFMLESRDYLTAHRGSSTVFLYVTPGGRDLYISRTTTTQTPISIARVAIFTLLLILMIIGLAQSGSPPSFAGGFSLGAAISTILINFSVPLLLFFLVLIITSLLAWLMHNDPGMYLRPAIMNDFQADDAALIQQAVDNSLLSAAKTAGIDESKITMSGQRQRIRQRIRWI